MLTVRPNPSPYIADWQNDPTAVVLVLSYTGSAPEAFHLTGRVMRSSGQVLSGRSIAYEFVRPSQLILTTRDGIWESGSVQYDAAVRSTLERTGRIPEGSYQFCVDVRRGIPEAPGTVLAMVCEPFMITAPEPPSIVAPAVGDTVVAEFPTFAWTPVIAPPGVAVSYQLRITEVLEGQSPIAAIGNIPQHEATLGTTAFVYPTDGYPLRDGATYVWQVQAVDAIGEPLGERQGKSEIGRFTYRPATRGVLGAAVVAQSDSADPEPAVARFTWAGVEVKVLSLQDSSRSNYTGRGRVRIIPGVFEPAIRFRSLRLTADGRSVDYAPVHRVRVPHVGAVLDWEELIHVFTPTAVQIEYVTLVADSATRERHVGISGTALVQIPLGTAEDSAIVAQDSIAKAAYDSSMAAYAAAKDEESAAFDRCLEANPPTVDQHEDPDVFHEQYDATVALCYELKDDELREPTKPKTSREWSYEEKLAWMQRHWLSFRFTDLHVGPKGPGGTITLARTWRSQNIGMSGFRMTLYQDETALRIADGVGTLDLKGDFTIPPSTGLVRDTTIAPPKTPPDVAAPDPKAIVLQITQARLSTRGELYAQIEGIPRALIGSTGLKLRTGETWIDFSNELSPDGRPGSWQGVYLDSARIFLPDEFKRRAAGDSAASIVGYALTIEESGFSGSIHGSRLEQLGRVDFAEFEGRLDSLHLAFTHGTLDTGYVEGALKVPFLDGDIDYWVNFTPVGVGQAYAKLTQEETFPIPALHATASIQRGEFTYERPVGTFSFDAKLDVDYDGITLRQAQVYGLTISNDGGMKLDRGWIGFDTSHEAGFKNFPVALDSIGFGGGDTGNEAWFGLAGRFRLSENLPSGNGAFRLHAGREAPGSPWRFSRLDVDKLDVQYQNAAVQFGGKLDYIEDDSVYGDGFRAAVQMRVKDQFSVDGNVLVGATPATTTDAGEDGGAAPGLRYWYVDAKLLLPPPGIQLGTLPLSLYGFGGGAYSRMRAVIDTVTREATYVPDAGTAFGLKALVTLGTSANAGYIWNADATLEAAVGASGGLSKLSLYGDMWMLTEVSRREERLWGKVVIDLPVSSPVFHATLDTWVDLPPALEGHGWAELHFAPTDWHLWVGTRTRPDSLTLFPGSLDLQSTAFFMMDKAGIDAGFATFLEKEKKSGIFYGRIAAGYEANAQMRYRPFMARGDGELWGEIVAKVESYTILSGHGSATMAFTMPDPMRVWGRIKLKYKLLNGTLKGTYRMRYSWGGGGDEENEAATFVLLSSTYPVHGDAQAPLGGISYYLGMGESIQYGLEDGSTYRLVAGTPVIEHETASSRRVCTPSPVRGRPPTCRTEQVMVWSSIGSVVREFDADRYTMTLRPPGYGLLEPGRKYRARSTLTLQRQGADGAWTTHSSRTDTIVFTTTAQPTPIGQYVEEVDPAGAASPLYHAGENGGAVRLRFGNLPPEITSGTIVGRVVSAAGDSVPGTWANGTYPRSRYALAADPRRFAFTPSGGALLPSTNYRFVLVRADSSAEEVYNVPFVTSRYASLDAHVAASSATVTSRSRTVRVGLGSVTVLDDVTVVLAGPEAIVWDDIEAIELVDPAVPAEITTRTRCAWKGGADVQYPPALLNKATLCGKTPIYESEIVVTFTGTRPPAGTASLTVRLHHRREGARTFTFTIPGSGQ